MLHGLLTFKPSTLAIIYGEDVGVGKGDMSYDMGAMNDDFHKGTFEDQDGKKTNIDYDAFFPESKEYGDGDDFEERERETEVEKEGEDEVEEEEGEVQDTNKVQQRDILGVEDDSNEYCHNVVSSKLMVDMMIES